MRCIPRYHKRCAGWVEHRDFVGRAGRSRVDYEVLAFAGTVAQDDSALRCCHVSDCRGGCGWGPREVTGW